MNVRNVWMSDDRSGLMFPREAANGETPEPSRAGNELSRSLKFQNHGEGTYWGHKGLVG